MPVSVHGKRQWRKIKDEFNKYNKMTILFAGITNVYVNVRGGCMWSSARWVMSSACIVEL